MCLNTSLAGMCFKYIRRFQLCTNKHVCIGRNSFNSIFDYFNCLSNSDKYLCKLLHKNHSESCTYIFPV